MKKYDTKHIRNLAFVGHSGSGKTTLSESLLYLTKAIDRPGRIEDGNTVSDFDKEEIARGISIGLSVLPTEWKEHKINLLDAPGYFDFEAQVLVALRAAEAALMVIDASAGIEVGSEIYWKYMEKISLPRIIFLNKMDKPNVNFNLRVSELHQQFGKKVVPLTLTLGQGESFEGLIDIIDRKAFRYDGYKAIEIPIPEERLSEVDVAYDEIVELIAMTDDALMEKYFNGEAFTQQEISEGMTTAMLNGSAVPLIAGSAISGAGLDLLMDCIVKYMPAPNDPRANSGFRPVEGEPVQMDASKPMSAVVFKTTVDPFVGKISLVKVVTGTAKKGESLKHSQGGTVKPAGMFFLRGKEHIDTDEITAGDIGAFSKLEDVETGDTLTANGYSFEYKKVKFPSATLTYAIAADSKNDEDKLSQSLAKLEEEDPTFILERNKETKQLLIHGLGNVQLESMMDKLKIYYGVNVHRVPLTIPYRETIRGKSDVQGRHKKQTGGAGQFGDVWVRFEPIEEGFEFAEEVFGGSVPKNYYPAVEKGLEESLDHGPLAGYPVTGIKATLYDGSYHPVDSNEMAFKIAAAIAFKKGMEEAHPILLEPIVSMKIVIPDEFLGDVMGDMNKRRGRILGMEQNEDGDQVVNAEAPMAEVSEYAIDLRSMTQGRGFFTQEFKNYEEAPAQVAEEIIAEAKKAQSAE
ncbi:MAG: elongation factor G [Peptoniphilaceae bacterium]|nr:elongation factor G [Peptoniphilaceae bacterium]MDD7434161.1 elongation factor G [Peptoniphilaceae bacterium]MDY3075257.1 elongation factor G [Peptoniphilaceae bacterium]MDY5841992.1 elongation factor G [Peptoniphilaceae bacterium]